MAESSNNEQPDRDLPEWVWNLRTKWVTTRAYQSLRDGITDTIVPLGGDWGRKNVRKNCDGDWKWRRHERELRERIASGVGEYSGENEYTYRKLETGKSFRLLRLLPGISPAPIKCELFDCNISTPPPYTALSYTWGRKIFHTIDCNGHSLKIQESLWLALQRLRHGHEPQLLWIDAICISQSDPKEKEDQVLLMRDLFGLAERVKVWLGEESEDSPEAFALIAQITRAHWRTVDTEATKPFTAQDLIDAGLPSHSSPCWGALDSIFWRAWFTRVWIIQEITVAKDAVVLCGRDECPWEDISIAANYVASHSLTAITKSDPHRIVKLANSRADYHNNEGKPLLKQLAMAREDYSTDDRDKIYALLGISPDHDYALFGPNYTKHVDEVYTALARHVIEQQGTLDILSAVEDQSRRLKHELPSWVPDWEVHPSSSPLLLHSEFPGMQAGGQTIAACTFSNEGRVLQARGAVVDTVAYVGDSFLEFVPTPGSLMPPLKIRWVQGHIDFLMMQRWRQWERMALRLKTYPTGEDPLDVYISTLVAGAKPLRENNEKQDEIEIYRTAYIAWRQYWSVVGQEHGRFIHTVHGSTSARQIALAHKFAEAQMAAAYGRRFFTTAKGYMGLSSSDTRAGHVVAILAGGRTPYMLRKGRGKETLYRFVGECYIAGLMGGETLRDVVLDEAFSIV